MLEPTLLAQQQRHLSSWKEIAQYFGRGVRTVQRWEAMLGLPVRRPHGRSRSAVMAITGELDEWLSRARLRTSVLNDGNGKNDGTGKPEPDGEEDRLFFVIFGEADNQSSASAWLKNRPLLQLKFVSDVPSALLALDDVHHGRLPVPDLIVVDQMLFDANAYQLFSYCQASQRLKNVEILVRPAPMQNLLLAA
ncbi:MAG TPA: hypothetical protein VGK01_23790 [Candidatus Angelobacter sp.]